MSKVATIEVVVPDEVKQDDVFNFMRNKQWRGALIDLKPNPNDAKEETQVRLIQVTYAAKGAQEASTIEDHLIAMINGFKPVQEAKIHA